MLKLFGLFLIVSLYFLSVPPAFGQNVAGPNADSFQIVQPKGAGIEVVTGTGSSAEGNVGKIMRNVVALFFVVGGVGIVIYLLWGAVEWIFSGGDKEKVAGARRRITHAIIGFVLLALSFVIIITVGRIVGFNPLSPLQIPGLGETNPVIFQP